jgi:hypothetical protein
MGWFRKKPSVQEMRADLGLIAGDPVPLHQYAPVLRDALNGAAIYREPSEIADDMGIGRSATPDQETALLQTLSNEFSGLTSRVHRLNEMRPDVAELLELHVAVADYLRQFTMVADSWNAGLRAEFQGDAQEAARLYAVSDRLGKERQTAQRRLAAELRSLQRKERSLYATLAIPHDTLVRLALT